jgi:heat shock protein HtpX
LVFESIGKNKIKSVFIFILVTVFMMVAIFFVATYTGFGAYAVPIAVVFAIVSSWSSYYFSDKIILSISGARPADRKSDKQVRDAMEGLCIAAGLPMPRVYIIEDATANAFATGRNPENAVVAVTTGLLKKLDYYELEAVLAHELAHIGNRDILLSTVVTVMIGIVVMLSDIFKRTLFFRGVGGGRNNRGHPIIIIIGFLFLLLAPFVGIIMRMALSRNREYLADATAVQFTRNPDGLKGALTKLSSQSKIVDKATQTTANLYIVNPFDTACFEAGKGFFSELLSTHPPIAKRIRALNYLR